MCGGGVPMKKIPLQILVGQVLVFTSLVLTNIYICTSTKSMIVKGKPAGK